MSFRKFADVYWSLAGTLMVVALLNLSAWAYLRAYPVNTGVSRVYEKWQMLERMTAPVDYLVLGDSACGQGIDPKRLATALGGTVINLCTVVNAGLVNDAWMLDRYLEKFGAPKGVIVLHVYSAWDRPPADLIHLLDEIPLPGQFWERLEPPLSLGILGNARQFIRPLLTLYEKNLSVSEAMRFELLRLFGVYDKPRRSASANIDDMVRTGGIVFEGTARPEHVSKEAEELHRTRDWSRFEVQTTSTASIRAMCTAARRDDFDLLIGNSSISDELYRNDGVAGFFTEIVKWLSSQIAECPTAKLIFKVPPLFSAEVMDNVDHVTAGNGVNAFTDALAGEIQASTGDHSL